MNNIFTPIQNTGSFKGIFSSSNMSNKSNDIFSICNNNQNNQNNQEDDEHCCEIINDEKTELSLIKESENESVSGTDSAFKSRKNSQLNLNNLKDNINLIEDKKKDEFLKPLDVTINKNEQNYNNFSIGTNNYKMDFEDEVNEKYGLFPIV